MSYRALPIQSPLRCPSCGAPVGLKPGDTVARCAYCGNTATVGVRSPPSPPPTIIVETRRRHVHPRRLRHLLEAAEAP